MIDIFLAVWDIFWKVALALVAWTAAKYIYIRFRKIKLKSGSIERAIALLIYAVALAIIAGLMFLLSGNGRKSEEEDLLEPRRVAAEAKLNHCLDMKPTKEELYSNQSDFYYDFKKIGCPEFLLYLDNCDKECRKKAIRIIKRSFLSTANE